MLKVHRLCFPTSNRLDIWLISFPTSNRFDIDILLKVDTRPFVDGKSAICPFLGGCALPMPAPNLLMGSPYLFSNFCAEILSPQQIFSNCIWCGDFI